LAGGAILRAVRDVMVMSPSLTVTKAEIDELIRILRSALDLTAKDVA
jgi:putrescine aminotransferase